MRNSPNVFGGRMAYLSLLSFPIDLELLLVFVCFRFIFLVFVIPINWWFVSFRFFSHMMHHCTKYAYNANEEKKVFRQTELDMIR